MILSQKEVYSDVNLYFCDEARFGLFTRNGKSLTAKGVKPICPFQQVFKYLYLFGAFSPLDGDSFLMEFPYCNAASFQIFLDQLAIAKKDTFNIIVLDNGAFHKAKSLKIPKNIVLIFLPPYAPELNPAEKIWWMMKRDFSNILHHNLDELRHFIETQVDSIYPQIVKKTCRFSYITNDNY